MSKHFDILVYWFKAIMLSKILSKLSDPQKRGSIPGSDQKVWVFSSFFSQRYQTNKHRFFPKICQINKRGFSAYLFPRARSINVDLFKKKKLQRSRRWTKLDFLKHYFKVFSGEQMLIFLRSFSKFQKNFDSRFLRSTNVDSSRFFSIGLSEQQG